MSLPPGLEPIIMPPHVRMVCACGGVIDALDRDDLRAHAVAVHRQTPEHQQWLRLWPDTLPRFEVRVVRQP